MRSQKRMSNLMKRDEILRKHVMDSGFLAFFIFICFGSLKIITDLFNKDITWGIAMYGLKLLGIGFLAFVIAFFMFTRAKKEYFTKNSARIVSLVLSIGIGIDLFTKQMELWIFLLGWVLMSVFIYKCINLLFEDINKNHPYF